MAPAQSVLLHADALHVCMLPTAAAHVLIAGELSGVSSAIVYMNSRLGCDMLAAQLKRAGIDAASYHAKLQYDSRQFVQVRSVVCSKRPPSRAYWRPGSRSLVAALLYNNQGYWLVMVA
jgi:hypothetical protein